MWVYLFTCSCIYLIPVHVNLSRVTKLLQIFEITQRNTCILNRRVKLAEAVARILFLKMFLKTLQNSRENTCGGVSF